MFIHIQVVGPNYREAMGKVYQTIIDSSYWEEVEAIHHNYSKRCIILDVAQPDVTDEQEDWLANQRLIENSWKSWDNKDENNTEMNHSEIAMIASEALQAEGVITWGEGGKLGDALLSIKDMADTFLASRGNNDERE